MLITNFYRILVFNNLINKFFNKNFSDFSTGYIYNH